VTKPDYHEEHEGHEEEVKIQEVSGVKQRFLINFKVGRLVDGLRAFLR
jgi:hypothetical protein